MRKLLKEQGFAPRLLVTDKLRSYASAFRRLRLTCPHEQGLRGNNRAENSHQAVQRRERNSICSTTATRWPMSSAAEVTFMIGDEVTVGGAGTCAFMPRGVPHAWKNTGAETGRVLFLYTPARAGGLIEEQQRTGRKFASMNERELAEICQRHGWELLGPPPL
jgi:hypothetical protein